jgi:ATP-dependent DNA helicase RecQ
MTYILRNYAGVFDLETKVDLDYLARKIKKSQKSIIKHLNSLKELEVIDLKVMLQDLCIRMLQPREDERSINIHKKNIDAYRNQKIGQIEAVINFIKNEDLCRQIQLLHYFNEEAKEPCGKCSVCQKNKHNSKGEAINLDVLQSKILSLLSKTPKNSSDILSTINCDKNILMESIMNMLQENIIELTNNNLYRLKE